MAADRVATGRSRTDQVLALYSACQYQASRPGAPGQAALDHRTRLPGAETRARLGALRRPRLARVSPPKHLSRVAYGPHKGERGYDPTQHQQYWDTAWDSLTKAAGLEGIRFHDLRHTFITHMVERGVPPRNDSGICGAHEYENAQALHAYHVRRCASHCETVGRRSHPHTREAGKRKGIPCVSYAAFCGGFCGLNHVRQHVRMLQAA